MDRRLVSWFILTTALFFIYTGLSQWFAKNKPAAPPVAAAPPASDAPATDQTKPTVSPAAPLPSIPNERFTLGSMIPEDNYELMVTFNSEGASIERIEAVDQIPSRGFRFKALDTNRAYIGHLCLEPAEKGLVVQAVGKGTPASLAKSADGGSTAPVQVGDTLVTIDEVPLITVADFDSYMEKTKPGKEVKLSLLRSGATQAETVLVKLIDSPMEMVRLTNQTNEEVVGNLSRLSCLTTLAAVGGKKIPVGSRWIEGLASTVQGNWESETFDVENGQGIEFSLPLAPFLERLGITADLKLVKKYVLYSKKAPQGSAYGDGYCIDMTIEVVNQGTTPTTFALRQDGLNGITLESWWYSQKVSQNWFGAAGVRDVVRAESTGVHKLTTCYAIYDWAKKNPQTPENLLFPQNDPVRECSLQYIGVDGYYFTTAFVPHPESPQSMNNLSRGSAVAVADVNAIRKSQEKATNVSFWIETTERPLEPGKSSVEKYRIFAGPKQPELLASYGLENTIEYGWYGFVAKPLSWVLHFFYAIVQNYGVSIVLLTFLVRGCLFPLGRQAALNAQRMQELAPELKKITEMYKDDFEKKARATQEFYAKNNFRPWAGCLPVFIQIPIFIGLYRCLSVDIELRQQSLIPGLDWCSNLSGPDMLLYWGGWMPDFLAGKGNGWLGPYFNILPVVTTSLFIVQQKIMMPKATDEQQEMTQKMMMYMTVFMGVLFFKVPAGLCLYFITSSIWSLIERRLVKRLATPLKKDVVVGEVVKSSATSTKGNATSSKPKPGWFEKIRQIADMANQENTSTHRNKESKEKGSDSSTGKDSTGKGPPRLPNKPKKKK